MVPDDKRVLSDSCVWVHTGDTQNWQVKETGKDVEW